MKRTVGIRELRAELAASVRAAGDGQRLVVTIGGVPVAELGPISSDSGRAGLSELAAYGLINPPRRSKRPAFFEPVSIPADIRLDQTLNRVRGQ